MLPPFTLHVRNLRAIRTAKWSPGPLSVLVGANGSGKTTLLLSLKLVRAALERGLPEAVRAVFGGSYNLRNQHAVDPSEPIEVGINIGTYAWRTTLIPRGATVDHITNETLTDSNRVIFKRDSLGKFIYKGEQFDADERIGLRILTDSSHDDPALLTVSNFIRKITVFHDPDVWSLRQNGSRTTDDRHLHSRGVNAFTMLRKWFQERPHRHRFEFVKNGLIAAFPGLIEAIDFKEAGQTIVLQTYRPGNSESPIPIGSEANGVLQLLILLCDVAQAEPGSLVSIDEPENSLHPFAIRSFLRDAEGWVRKHRILLLLTTHSPVVLNHFNADPASVFVLSPTAEHVPIALPAFKNADWLRQFQLGELYENSDLGSNDDPAR